LFLGAGSVIHALFGDQDIRRMGNLQKLLPVTYVSMFIGSISLMGLPFLSGFYSKDVIVERGLLNFLHSMEMQMYLGYVGVIGTMIYTLRLI